MTPTEKEYITAYVRQKIDAELNYHYRLQKHYYEKFEAYNTEMENKKQFAITLFTVFFLLPVFAFGIAIGAWLF